MKRLLAMLLCVCLVLGMVPAGIVLPVSAEVAEELTVDESGQAYCEACDKTVTWTGFSGNAAGTQSWGLKKDGGHYHVYLSDDVNARTIKTDFINLQNKTTMCLHLNGHNLVHGGYIFIANSTLNIMGDGNVTFTATNTAGGYDQAGLYSNSGTFNLYGGTYSVAEDALEEGKPAMKLALVNSAANVMNATIKGQTIVTKGMLTLDGASNVENIQVETGGKLFVKRGWTGESQAAFSAQLQDNIVPAANGASDGEFTGTLKMQHGLVLKGSEAGTLTATGINANLVLDANSQALCPVCNETVTWTAFSGNAAGTQRYGQVDDGKHYHVYLSADVDARKIPNYFMHVFSKSQMCLHLNGHDLTYGGYIYVSAATLNIMGLGNMTFTGTKTSSGYDQAGLYMTQGTINLWGGNFQVAEVAETAGKPMIHLNDTGSVVVKNASVYGQTYIKKGTLTLENEAWVEDIQVETTGKLVVKSNWSGNAKVAFAAEPEEYHIPAANASAESGFTGALKMADGSELLSDGNGGLYIKNLNANLVLDENAEALCPVCDKVVKWSAFSGNTDGTQAIGTRKDGEHYHIYLAEDVNARKIANDFLNLQGGTKMCLHLNGHDLVHGGYIFVAGATLNIMGNGNVIFTATNTSNTYDQGALYANASGIFNLYGGTYSVAEDALAEGKPTLCLALAGSAANLQNATVSGQLLVKNGTLTLAENANAESIRVEASGKLAVDKTWSGTGSVSFAADLQNNVVPTANGVSNGAFSGKLKMQYGLTLAGSDAGTLTATGINANLVLDSNSQALCPVCNTTVTWTAFAGSTAGTTGLGTVKDGVHRHIYLSQDVNAKNVPSMFLNLMASNKMCLHLNGHDLVYGGYIMVAGQMNIIGSGSTTFTDTDERTGYYDISGLYANGGTITLYGGTHGVSGRALELAKPTVHMGSGQVIVKDAVLLNTNKIAKGTMTLEQTAQLEELLVDAGKLVVKSSWSGEALVSFTAQLVDDKVPTANGSAESGFTGTLWLPDGSKLKLNKDGVLVATGLNSALVLDDNAQGECPLCEEVVTWTEVKDGQTIGWKPNAGHLHYYLAGDVTSRANSQFTELELGTKVCLHLNGNDLTLKGQCRLWTNSELNIMGNGNVVYEASDAREDWMEAAILSLGGTANLYGGTYTVSGLAAEADKPAVLLRNAASAKVTISGATVSGPTRVELGNLILDRKSDVSSILVGVNGKLTVSEKWTGTAQADFDALPVNDEIPAENAVAEGNFEGVLTMPDDSHLVATEKGTLKREVVLTLDSNSQALCPVCNEVVTWTAFAGAANGATGLGEQKDGAKHHYYLSADVDARYVKNYFLNMLQKTQVCLHLNGHDLAYGGYIMSASYSILNIMGSGNVTFTATNTNHGNYDIAGIYVNYGTVNLYGGTYSVGEDALAEGKAMLHQNSGTLTIKDATVNGRLYIPKGTTTLEGDAKLETIQVTTAGKLTVAENWIGTANVSFDAGLVDGAVPAANGAATGDFAGGLKLADGTLLIGKDGRLVQKNDTKLRINEDGVGYCQLCGQIVKWKAIVDGGVIGTLTEKADAHHHYYFADDAMTTAAGKYFVRINKGNTVCLHLNDKTVTVTGALQILDGGVLNMLGDGKVDFLGNTATTAANAALFHVSNWGEKKINIYGGTYTSSTGKEILKGSGGNFTVNMIAHLYGDTHLDGLVTLTQSQLHLHDSARVTKIEGSNTASIRVAENWRGGAVVEYLNEQVNEYLSEYNGRSEGDFIGGLMLSDGRRLIGESGKLRIVEAELMLTEENEGYCEACNAVVSWQPVAGADRIGFFNDGVHRHYYLSGNLNMPDTLTQVLGLQDTSCCVHLNGHNMTQGGRIFATGESSVLSIMGPGNVTFTASSTAGGDEYRVAGIRMAGNSQVKLLGGTYSVAGKALEENKPTVSGIGRAYIKNARINGWIENSGRTVTLDGTTTADKIVVGATERLILEDSWSGSASVTFKGPYIGNELPANRLAGTAHSGILTLTDGRPVVGTSIGGETIDPGLSYHTSETDAQIVAYTGEGNFLLPTYIAGKPVTAIAADAFVSFTGTLYIARNNEFGIQYAKDNDLTYVEATSFQQADGTVQLLEAAAGLTFEKDAVLDLNGYSVDGLTVTNGTLTVKDSSTADFTVADGIYGKLTNVTGTVQAADGYLQVTEDSGISFHRVDLDIYAMSLRANKVGVYYKSQFAADEVVAPLVESYGVALSVIAAPDEENLSKHCGYSEFSDFQAGYGANAGSSTLLKGIMKESNGDEKNARNAQMPVYGRAYIKTANGYFFGEPVQRSLREQVELANENFEALTHEQKNGIREMCETYRKVTEKWDITNIGNYTDRVWFDTPAPDTGTGFEQYAIPLGNGYTGISVFGGTESELLSISDKTMFNPGVTGEKNAPPASDSTMQYGQGGLTNMSKAYIDFGHDFAQVTDYQRDLVMDTAQAHVHYTYDGVTYDRTYFASYPDNVLVTKLEASESGKLSFTLRPVATFVRDYAVLEGDGHAKTGTVTASGNTAIVAGMLTTYQINYETQYRVIPVGGTMKANADGTITVENADSAVILMSAGTNYELKPETLTAPNKEKLDPNSFPHEKVTAVLDAAEAKTYEQLLQTHLADYQALYGSVEVDLGGTPSTELTTSDLMDAYRAGNSDPYLEELLFQYGRYLLIASSRSGTLPANLQGIWQYYPAAAWDGKYVYNINLQMNYWGCFATNLAELFEPNIEFFDAIYPTLQSNADKYLTGVKSPYKEESGTGANGIAIGSTGTPYITPTVSTSVSTHTGPGSTGYTSDLFWQYYQFTMDDTVLKEKIYPYLEGSATFLSKTLENYDGKWLVSHSASPENNLYFDDSIQTVGTMFDQMMTRESFVQMLEAARLLKYTAADSPILSNIEAKLPLLDPVNVGKSGHVKEYREEEYYGELGLYEHHGMGQLVGVYPGTTITSKTDAWQDAAAATAIERGINFTGHQASFKQLVWARLGDAANSYLVAQEHIVRYIRDNLLNTHAPFQIDGNFGYTAGVAEMLIQSHEGYIKVLPALPQQWNTGSYKGLTARGGFEVDVEWTDGNATKVAITSNAGQPCSLNHFRVSTATVVDSKGNPVAFTVENEDLITFATAEGETYTITNLPAKPHVEAPADLTLTDGSKLSWEASADAVSYRVYRAVNDQATYELIADNVTETSYTYIPTDLKAGDQLILRVTAVNADGVESKGVRFITWDIVINEQDAEAMEAANAAYRSYTGETAEYLLYQYEGRFVVLHNGVAISAHNSKEDAMNAIYDDPFTTKDEETYVEVTTTDGIWYVCGTDFSDMTYVAFGDSITYGIDGNFKSTEAGYKMAKPYPTLVGDTLGLGKVSNQAVSGASFCPQTGRTNMTQKILSFTGEADMISLLLGVNDFSSKSALGDTSSRENSTVYGSLYLISEYLTTNYPDAFIFYMTPFQYKLSNNGVYNLEDIATAVKTVAAEYGIPVLDMYNEGKFELEMNVSPNDGIHPSQQHHITYTAPLICEFVKENYKSGNN